MKRKVVSKKELIRIAKKFKNSSGPYKKDDLLKKNYYIQVKDYKWSFIFFFLGILLIFLSVFFYNLLKIELLKILSILFLFPIGFFCLYLGKEGRWTRLQKIESHRDLFSFGNVGISDLSKEVIDESDSSKLNAITSAVEVVDELDAVELVIDAADGISEATGIGEVIISILDFFDWG